MRGPLAVHVLEFFEGFDSARDSTRELSAVRVAAESKSAVVSVCTSHRKKKNKDNHIL